MNENERRDMKEIVEFYYGITSEQYKDLKESIKTMQKCQGTKMATLIALNIAILGLMIRNYFLK